MRRGTFFLFFIFCINAFAFSPSALNFERKFNTCDDFFRSEKLSHLVSQYKKLKTLPDIWMGYQPENEVLVISSTDAPNGCAVLIEGQSAPSYHSFKGEFTYLNGVYNMFFDSTFAGEIPKELKDLFSKKNISRATIYNLSSLPNDIAPDGYEQYLYGRDDFHLNVIVHEAFHLNTIFAKALGREICPWPKWDLQPEREITSYCYKNETWNKENHALVAAFNILYLGNNRENALKAAQAFIERREERYAALVDVKVPSQFVPGGVSCAEAEATLELQEGMADYVGTTASMELGIVTPFQVSGHLTNYHDWYYRSALAQMLFMRKLDPQYALETTQRLANSKNWNEGVFSEFKKFVKSRSSK